MGQASIGVTLQGPADRLAPIARRFEDVGVESIWTGDYFQAGPVRAAVIGTATTRAQVGIHVLQAFARSPLATALLTQELQTLTGGRFVLGLGSQVAAANERWHGMPTPKPIRMLGEYVAAVRELLASPGSATFDGTYFRYRVPAFRPPQYPGVAPVVIGGAGPATTGLAARLEAGMAGHLLWTYAHVRDVVRPVLGNLPLSVPRYIVPADEIASTEILSRRLAHYLVTPSYEKVLTAQGIEFDRAGLLRALRENDQQTITAVVAPLLDHWAILGADRLANHLRAAASAGIDTILLMTPADPASGRETAAAEESLSHVLAKWTS